VECDLARMSLVNDAGCCLGLLMIFWHGRITFFSSAVAVLLESGAAPLPMAEAETRRRVRVHKAHFYYSFVQGF
jgi:hypothetical protein